MRMSEWQIEKPEVSNYKKVRKSTNFWKPQSRGKEQIPNQNNEQNDSNSHWKRKIKVVCSLGDETL